MDFSAYRLNSAAELKPFLLEPHRSQFFDFTNRVYAILMKMKPGESLDVEREVSPPNRKMFVKLACLFITEGNADYEFTNDYSAIRRALVHPAVACRELERELEEKKRRKNNDR